MSEPPPGRAGTSAMALRKELLKSIWYAFTALDVEKSGKVSKSQLKVRGPRSPGEAGTHAPQAPAAQEPGNNAVLMALSHPKAQAWGREMGPGGRDSAACWMLLPMFWDPREACAEPLPRDLPPNSLEGGGGIIRF